MKSSIIENYYMITCRMLRVTCYVLHTTCYMLRVTCYMLHATLYILFGRYYTSFMFRLYLRTRAQDRKKTLLFFLLHQSWWPMLGTHSVWTMPNDYTHTLHQKFSGEKRRIKNISSKVWWLKVENQWSSFEWKAIHGNVRLMFARRHCRRCNGRFK